MRLRTLPVSLAGVVAAAMAAVYMGDHLLWAPLVLCTLFAVLAQIASNFANEYFDYKAGIDAPGRVGPRRGVTEGDITPRAMLTATLTTLGLACVAGCALMLWSGWWLLPIGIAVALGALAYSAGPWPLSRHGLGEVAVLLFFGIVPVTLTYRLITGHAPGAEVWCVAAAIGLMGSCVLLVNNIRDRQADALVGKHTLAVLLGARVAVGLYALCGIAATALLWQMHAWWPLVYLTGHALLTVQVARRHGAALNPLLGMTAMWMFINAWGY